MRLTEAPEGMEQKGKFTHLKSLMRTRYSSLSRGKRITLILGSLVLLFLLVFSAYSFWDWNIRGLPEGLFGGVKVGGSAKPSEEGTIPSPINGLLYTEEQAALWQERRPMAVMINNHIGSRPQEGLSQADLVIEAVAEGGITRFLAIFHSQTPEKVGSVRSARVYFVDWAREYDAWYAHWGGAQIDPNRPWAIDPRADSFAQMRNIFVSSIDQMTVGSRAFWREPRPGLATEHTGFASVPELYKAGYSLYPDQVRKFRGLESWKFKDDIGEKEHPPTASARFNFWDNPQYEVRWEYDPEKNVYLRFQGGEAQKDALSGEQLSAKNVILEFMKETSLFDEKAHLLYETQGTGKAIILRDGKVLEVSWVREKVADRTRFFDLGGNEIEFNRGQIWVEIVPAGNKVILE